MTRRKTDGERIADRVFSGRYQSRGMAFPSVLAADIDRIIRRSLAEAWRDGWFERDRLGWTPEKKQYRGRRRK